MLYISFFIPGDKQPRHTLHHYVERRVRCKAFICRLRREKRKREEIKYKGHVCVCVEKTRKKKEMNVYVCV